MRRFVIIVHSLPEFHPTSRTSSITSVLPSRKSKQWPEAIDCFQSVLKLQPNSVDAHNNLGTIFFMQGDFKNAAAQFSAAQQLLPDDVRFCANLAGTYVNG